MKGGQVSIFVIIAVLILAVIIAYIIVSQNNIATENKIDNEIEPIHSFVEECLQNSVEEALFYIGQTGGYVTVPQPNLEEGVAFYLYDGKNYMPSRETIQNEISSYVDFSLPFCINDFEMLSDFDIEKEGFTIDVTIEDKKVFVNLGYPLTITKGEHSYYLENFNTEIPVRLGTLYEAIRESMDEQMERTDAVCISCNYKISEKYNVTFDFLDTNETTTLLVIVRNSESILNYERYAFNYAIKLDERNDV